MPLKARRGQYSVIFGILAIGRVSTFVATQRGSLARYDRMQGYPLPQVRKAGIRWYHGKTWKIVFPSKII